MLNSEPKMEKNHVVALILCMFVLMTYPFILKKFAPPAQPVVDQGQERAVGQAPERENPKIAAVLERSPEQERLVKEEVISYENTLYRARFSTRGAMLKSLIYKGDPGKEEITKTIFLDQGDESKGLFGTSLVGDIDLKQAIFTLTRPKDGVFVFIFEKPKSYRIEKKYILSKNEPILNLEMNIQNLSQHERNFALEVEFAAENKSENKVDEQYFETIAWTNKTITAKAHKVSKKGFHVAKEIVWAGIVKKYFALLIKPEWPVIALDAQGSGDVMGVKLTMTPLSIAAQASLSKQFFIYAGPQEYEYLKSFGVGFENILSKGFFGVFKIWLLKALKFSHRYTHNFGWDILFLTLIIKLLFAPLTHMSYKSMEKMKALQPKQKALQEKHKKDPQKMNKEMMELYKKHKVNPMGGCLPMVLQIPVFIAFYQVLGEAIELRGAPFIGWIMDLSKPDALFAFPSTLPLLGDSFNLLPILMMVSMVIQQKMTPQSGVSPEQQKIFAFMPIIFGFIFYGMPSGLVLYWFVSNLLSIAQQVYVRGKHAVVHHD